LCEFPFGCNGVYVVLRGPHANDSAQSTKVVQILVDVDCG